ncbi:ABC transporter permease [Phaeobacter sp. 11ANDIMAR09]|uniref:ABC transporter permease n=1 Tax=Phaeobacter sp. 11ANDIMAR09 TaxID=1225647 RepID=UPI0006C8C9E8|nr:ABC transporter permease [Phaeobacter sp. 11ANDIMAR09]KPD11770.1 sugar ABC transporter permease [Phaeobacter sp. 11ANDIMAR09]
MTADAPRQDRTSTEKTSYVRRFATTRTIMALLLREMTTRYGRSPGGYVWALLEPIGAIMIFAVGFSLLFNTPPLGSSFILFFATGFLPFNLYQNVSVMVARALVFSRPLLFYPAVTWVDAVIARFTLNALTGILVTFILFSGIILATETRTALNLLPIIQSVALALLLGFAVGVLNCALMGLIQVWDLLWSVATRPLFLASGVLFIFEDMPQMAQSVLWYNPLVHILGIMRQGFFPLYEAHFVSVPYVLFCSLIPMFFGVLLLSRYHRDILNK